MHVKVLAHFHVNMLSHACRGACLCVKALSLYMSMCLLIFMLTFFLMHVEVLA